MATVSYLNSDLTFNRAAIMSAAWASARVAVARNQAAKRDKWWMPLTLRQAFADALRRVWDLAKGHRASIAHFAAAKAEDSRRSALPVTEREALNLRDARAIAPMTDSTRRMVADIVAIDVRAASLGLRL